MKEILCALLVLRVVTGSSIITKTMLYGPEGDSSLEMVQLQTKEPSNVDSATTTRTVKIRKTSKELLRSLGYFDTEANLAGEDLAEVSTQPGQLSDSDDPEDSAEDDYYSDTTPMSSTFTTIVPQISTKDRQIKKRENSLMTDTDLQNRTKLFPVGRLWERTMPSRPMPGLMAILDAAFSCLWSGLGFECFSMKVVPMFRAMMGFPPVNPFGHPFYVLPRTTEIEEYDEDKNEQDSHEADSKVLFAGRRRRRPFFGLKLMKGAMIVFAALKTFLIPLFTGLSLVSAKAIIFSLTAVVLTIAAGWSSVKNSDRRIYNSEPDNSYYM